MLARILSLGFVLKLAFVSCSITDFPDTLQRIYRETDSENVTSVLKHKEASSGRKGNATKSHAANNNTLSVIPSVRANDTDTQIHEANGANNNTLSVIPSVGANDTDTQIHQANGTKEIKSFHETTDIRLHTENDKLSSDPEEEDGGIAPLPVDVVLEAEETISPFKIQYNGDIDESNITDFARKEFNKKLRIHSKKSGSHKNISGNENWDKYLTDDGWVSNSNKEQEKQEDTNSKDFSGEREQLNDDEKTMINYVSDSIIESVKNVKHPQKETTAAKAEGSGNDLVTYKKLDSGKKPYIIYRVKQSKNDSSQPLGIDAVDAKTQKIIPGAKNINIIIMNNDNNTLDLNDIENTIARSTENRANSTNSESVIETPLLSGITETPATSINTTLLSKAEAIIRTIEKNALANSMISNADTDILVNNYDKNNDINNAIGTINLKVLNTSITKNNNSDKLGDNYNDTDIERKFNESKQYLDNKNASVTRIFVDVVEKNTESTVLQSPRKSGLVTMNYAPEEIEIKTFGGNAIGKKCMFPFIYNGDTYFNCINLNRDKPWCSITANYDKIPKWGYCNIENNIIRNSITNNTNYDKNNDIDNALARINLNVLDNSIAKINSDKLGDYNDADIERKFDESKQYLDNTNASFTRLLVDSDHNVDKNSESPALQSLRKSGLVSMNYAPEEIEIKTFGGNANGKKCMFPFIYNGDTYFNCINLNKDKPWCSITANYDKTPKWGYCNDEQLAIEEGQGTGKGNEAQKQLAEMVHNQGEEVVSKHSGMKTFGGNANGARCVMPFVYDGQTHESCIPLHDGTTWCAASHSYDLHPIWGNCCENEIC